VFDPPPGFDDLLADAETCGARGELSTLHIEDFGDIQARRPTPRSAAALAMSVNRKALPETRGSYQQLFVADHLADTRFVELLVDMLEGRAPDDALFLLCRGIATWGTSRPYTAVITLAAITAHHWRTVRNHLITHGVSDPMGLPSLHALLDVTESMVIDSIQEAKPEATKRKRQEFYDRLYAPEKLPTRTAKPLPTARPDGFDDEEVEASFDSFARMITTNG
jgi:hypothetical protein